MSLENDGLGLLSDADSINADDELALEEDLAAAGPAAVAPTAVPPLGSTPAYDFASQTFLPSSTGGTVRLYGLATLGQWCEKCLLTRIGESPAVAPSFGVTILPTDLLDGDELDEAELAEAFADWSDALLRHPRISSVEDWDAAYDDEEGTVSVSVSVTPEGMYEPIEVALTMAASADSR